MGKIVLHGPDGYAFGGYELHCQTCERLAVSDDVDYQDSAIRAAIDHVNTNPTHAVEVYSLTPVTCVSRTNED